MKTLTTASDFLETLRKSKLLKPELFEELEVKVEQASSVDAMTIAKSLVKAGHLTRLQANRLLEGRTRGFFINDYRIDEVLGSGGMGFVYIARNMKTNEEVALKMLCEQSEVDAGLLTRFRLEAEAGQKLNHHAIIRTHEIGKAIGLYGDIHYMVMDLVRGVGVDELVSMAGPIGWPVACHIVRHVAAGLHHAHRQGLVHRDIKPANILVDENANAKVLDFGLSVASQSTQDDEFSLAMIFGQDCLGTADYIAPEQAVDSFAVDRRADIYSLGATMYYMLCGHVMFPEKKTRADKIEAQLNEFPPPIRDLVPNLPQEVAAIIDRMLAKKREHRFETARGVSAALAPFAKPKHISFSFQQILDRRASLAQQRKKLLDERAKRAAAASSLSVCTLDSKTNRPVQAQIETTIHKDTQVGQAGQPSDAANE